MLVALFCGAKKSGDKKRRELNIYSMDSPCNNQYLFYYAQDHPEFRLPELSSISACIGAKFSLCTTEPKYQENKPFLKLNCMEESDIAKIAGRSILMRYAVELWACGCSLEELLNQKETVRIWLKKFFKDESITFKLDVEAFNKKMSLEMKKEWINKLGDMLIIPGKVKLKDPDHTLCLLLNYSSNSEGEKCLEYIYFGRLVAYGQRDMIHKYSLKTRHFIGNTSMDPQLSFLMANQGKVKKGSFVYDPFVGTGSILICCAHFGAYTAGSDIDRSIIYGRGKSSRAGNNSWRARDEIIRTNYDHYGLLDQYIDVMVADVTQLPLRGCEIFDAVITDPPYGIREGGRKLNAKEGKLPRNEEDEKDQLYPTSSLHQLSDIILDLIHFAAVYLRKSARLVYWLPVYAPDYTDELVPKHPCFTLVSNSEQKLTSKISRRLITMEKTDSPQTDEKLAIATSMEGWRSTHNQFRSNYFKGKS